MVKTKVMEKSQQEKMVYELVKLLTTDNVVIEEVSVINETDQIANPIIIETAPTGRSTITIVIKDLTIEQQFYDKQLGHAGS